MKKAVFFTLGCKLNQAETAQVRKLWESAGVAEATDGESVSPDIIFVNGCAVTQRAEAKTRHAIARLARQYPQASVIVGGCAGKADPDGLAKMPGVIAVIDPKERFQTGWMERLKDFADLPIKEVAGENEFGAISIGDRSRPFLKIQDGCDHYCSYCIIPYLRGECRSVSMNAAMGHAEALVQAGYDEFVLTGIRIGSWGLDFPQTQHLTELLEKMLTIPGLGRIRLGSIEPWELTPSLIRLVIEQPKLCSHLHVPLQHTHPEVLRRMGRDAVELTMKELRRAKASNIDLGLGTDIIVGFPGETDQEFQQLTEDLMALPLTYLHAFSFSERRGTKAVEMPGKISEQVKKNRAKIISDIGLKKKRNFLQSQVGKIMEVIPDHLKVGEEMVSATADNYIKVKIPYKFASAGKSIRVVINEYDGKFLRGLPEKCE